MNYIKSGKLNEGKKNEIFFIANYKHCDKSLIQNMFLPFFNKVFLKQLNKCAKFSSNSKIKTYKLKNIFVDLIDLY